MNKEYIKYGIIAIAIIFILKIVNRLIASGTQGGQSDERVEVDPKNLTYTFNDYELFADTIETAGLGNAFWEDDQLIFETMAKMQTNDDLYQLVKAFGVRSIGVLIVDSFTLIQLVERILDNDYKNKLNQLYSTRGIKYQFSLN